MLMCHAALAAIEAKAVFDGTSSGPDLSEQQMMDCITADPSSGSDGCRRGYLGEYVCSKLSFNPLCSPVLLLC